MVLSNDVSMYVKLYKMSIGKIAKIFHNGSMDKRIQFTIN